MGQTRIPDPQMGPLSSDNRSSQALQQARAQSGSQGPVTASPWSPEATSPHGPAAAGAVKGQRSPLARKHSNRAPWWDKDR